MQDADELHLRAELRGHEEDVRGVITCPLGVITASRDKTIRVWTESEDKQFQLNKSLVITDRHAKRMCGPSLDCSFLGARLVTKAMLPHWHMFHKTS